MDSRDKTRFSIVIPCYNEAAYIATALQSLQAQDYEGNYEVIVVDNNCTDDTATIAKSFGTRVIKESNPGVCWARQAGTKAARGEIVISTDADTKFAKSWLSQIDQSFQRQPAAVAVAGPCRYYDGPLWGKLYPHLLFGAVRLYYRAVGQPFYVTATNIAFKKSAWPGYDTSKTQGGDELGLLHDLKLAGRIIFDNSNPSFTSARRLSRGLTYNLFISFIFYYLIEYHLSRLFKRPVFGSAPAYRESKLRSMPLSYGLAYFTIGLFIMFHFSVLRHDVKQVSYKITDAAADLIKALP